MNLGTPTSTGRSRPTTALAGLCLLTATGLVAQPGLAGAAPDGGDVVISEVYGGGGNSGATWTHDFIELHNPTAAPISLDGWSVSYYSSSGSSGGSTSLTGSLAPGAHYLVQEAKGAGGTTPLPTPDATGTLAMSGSNGSVSLQDASGQRVDLVGYGSATLREGTATPALSNTTSASRDAAGTDTDDNRTDFTVGEPTPQASGSGGPTEPPAPEPLTIAEIQGTGSRSPVAGRTVTTRGVVTAAYPTGSFWSFVIQTPGTGAGADATPGASDGLWVHQARDGVDARAGQYVEVTGAVSERSGRTELRYDPADGPLTVLTEPHEPVTPLVTAYPATFTEREAHESELLDLSGQEFTVSNNYLTNRYGEVGLATGDRPLITPTEVADAQDAAAVDAVQDDNHARGVVLDDGSSWDYRDDRNTDDPLPWLSAQNTARIGAPATVVGPVVLDYGFGDWRLQPTSQVTDEGRDVVAFGDTRSENLVPQDVGGDLGLATFNVLNYFNTTGMDYEAAGGSCSYYYDRAGDEVTTRDCGESGPRGAAEADDLERQQAKIVAAINALDADVVSLEEIENSVKLGENHRDDALKALVHALNADAGTTRWARVPSPPARALPPLAEQDVIRNAFIFNPATVDMVGRSQVLVGSAAFSNAREPLAQAFTPKGAGRSEAFAVVTNHFKSKGSACAEDEDDVAVPGEELQGSCNERRVAQAEALVDFADSFGARHDIERVFLAGDFNSYSMEDPIQALEAAGYTRLVSDTPDEWSYSFDGMSGSLDHVLANDAALADVTGVDTWEINANEAVAFEYSRHNTNVTDFYEPGVFRASDHNPELVGIAVD
jgi:5'-nucleotidase